MTRTTLALGGLAVGMLVGIIGAPYVPLPSHLLPKVDTRDEVILDSAVTSCSGTVFDNLRSLRSAKINAAEREDLIEVRLLKNKYWLVQIPVSAMDSEGSPLQYVAVCLVQPSGALTMSFVATGE